MGWTYQKEIKHYVDKKTKCHICTSHQISKGGYPQLTRNRKKENMARWLYIQKHGEIPTDMLIRHKCDNPGCINLEHLELGTHQDNMDDRANRGRIGNGIKARTAKLTEKQVLEIRKLYKTSKYTYQKLAIKYHMTKQNIGKIINKQSWKHIK